MLKKIFRKNNNNLENTNLENTSSVFSDDDFRKNQSEDYESSLNFQKGFEANEMNSQTKDPLSLNKEESNLDDYTKDKDIDIDTLTQKNFNKENKNKLNSFKYKAISLGVCLTIGVLGTFLVIRFEEDTKKIEKETEISILKMNYHLKNLDLGLSTYQLNKVIYSWKEIEKLNLIVNHNLMKIKNDDLDKIIDNLNLDKFKEEFNFIAEIEKNRKEIIKSREVSVNNIDEIIYYSELLTEIYKKNNSNNLELKNLNDLNSKLNEMKLLLLKLENEDNFYLFNEKREEIKDLLVEIAEGNSIKDVKPILLEAISTYNHLATKWNSLMSLFDVANKEFEIVENFKNIKESTISLFNKLDKSIIEINKIFEDKNNNIQKYDLVYYSFLILSIFSISLLLLLYINETKRKEKILISESNKNKDSILKLLDEMMYLKNGDLTQKTTINESVTANIAESINSTIDSLAIVVKKIQKSSLLIKEKTKQINTVAEGLLYSTEHQSNSISEVNNSIKTMTNAIEKISEKTKNILEMAEKSTEASKFGMQNVKNSMSSMLLIDKNMEETVFLMKKVSNSSRQIYEVINLLTDITEETNILALNATVQASKAGEAGEGFKIVANAIHELADKAGEATRKVAALISTVQTDIQSVASSIETTTEDVNNGVELSESVEKSLNDISNLSSLLENTIKLVSEDVKNNAQIAKQISQNMGNILSVTEETKMSARNTSKAISEVDNISSELTASVQSFVVEK